MTMEEELEAAEEERWCMVVCHHHHQQQHPRHFSPDENISLTQSKKLSYIAGCGLNPTPFTLSIAIKVKFLERACHSFPSWWQQPSIPSHCRFLIFNRGKKVL